MAYMAQWGSHIFSCTNKKLLPFHSFKGTMSIKSESQKDAEGTDVTVIKGREPETVNLSAEYLLSAGVNPWKEIDGWRQDLGNAYPLYIGGKRYGNSKFMLKSVDVSDMLANNTGRVLGVKVTISLTEHINGLVVYSGSGTSSANKDAMDATASADDRMAYKATAVDRVVI